MSVSDGQHILKHRDLDAGVVLERPDPLAGQGARRPEPEADPPHSASPNGLPSRSFSASQWTICLAVLGLIALYIPVLGEVGHLWLTNDTYSHGLLVLPASLALLWLLRDRLRSAAFAPDPRGLGWIALGLFAEAAGWYLRIKFLMMVSLVPVVAGCMLALHGRALWAAARFPVLFLIFSVPIPGPALELPSGYIQQASTLFSTHLMELLGFVVRRYGNVIIVLGAKLEVADACSGFRKLYAMLAFAAFYCYLYDLPARKRVMLILAVIPIATAANIMRIAGLIAVASTWGQPGLAVIHDPADIFVIVISALLFFALARRIGCIQTRFAGQTRELPAGWRLNGQRSTARLSLPAAVLCALVLCALFANRAERLPFASPHKVPLDSFPRTIGEWVSTPKSDDDVTVNEEVKKSLPHADIRQWLYHDKQNHTVSLSLITATDYADFHDPAVCIPAQGWDLSKQHEVKLPGQTINSMTANQSGTRFAVLYWLSGDYIQQYGRQLGKLLSIRERLTGEQGGSVVVRVDVPEAEGGERTATDIATDFAQAILPDLKKLTDKALILPGKGGRR